MIINPKPLLLEEHVQWETVLMQPLKDRDNYEFIDNKFTFTQVSGAFLGVFDDNEDFEEYIYLLANEPANNMHCYHQVHGFKRDIDNQRFQSIQMVLNLYEKDNLSLNRFIAFLDGNNLFPFKNDKWQVHYRNTFKRVLEMYYSKYSTANPTLFKRIVVDLIKWSWNHLVEWISNEDFEEVVPRIMWYGDAKESEVYFLYFLHLFGCDVVVFHPGGENIFNVLAENSIQTVQYSKKSSSVPFPKEKPTRRTTVAQKALNELSEVLYDETANMYRSWQLREYIPRPITLKTTYDEIFILRPEKAMMRQEFKAIQPYVEIPNLFSKIAGVSKDKNEYQTYIQQIVEQQKLVHIIDQFPFIVKYKANMDMHYQYCLEGERLSVERLISTQFWPYKSLPSHLQKSLAEIIVRVIYEDNLKEIPNESLESKRSYILGQAMMLPQSILRLLQQFDYSQEIPLLMLCINEYAGNFSREDAVLLLILNQMGIDILLLNPTGQNDIEQYIDEQFYDIHWLDEMAFDENFFNEILSIQPKSVFKRLFKKIF